MVGQRRTGHREDVVDRLKDEVAVAVAEGVARLPVNTQGCNKNTGMER